MDLAIISSLFGVITFIAAAFVVLGPFMLVVRSAERVRMKVLWFALVLLVWGMLATTMIAAAIFVFQDVTALYFGALLLVPAGILLNWVMYWMFVRQAAGPGEIRQVKARGI